MAALEGLAGIGHPTSVSVFKELLTSSNADMRRLAVEGLARAGNRDALPNCSRWGRVERSSGVLLALHYANVKLGAADGSLQQLVARCAIRLSVRSRSDICSTSRRRSLRRLAESLQDQSADVRRLVADVLGFSRDASVIPALEAAAKDPIPMSPPRPSRPSIAVQTAIVRACRARSTPGRRLWSRPICSARCSCTARAPASPPASSSKSRRTSASPIPPATPRRAPRNATRRCTGRRDTPTSI